MSLWNNANGRPAQNNLLLNNNPNFGGGSSGGYYNPTQTSTSTGGYNPNLANGPMYFQQPSVNINTPQFAYTPKYNSNTTIGGLIGKIGGLLKPAGRVIDYDAYANPQREVFNQFYKNTLRPEFERETLNPFNNAYGNNAAASNASMMGNSRDRYQLALAGVEKPFADRNEGLKNAYEEMIRQGYNTRIGRQLDSPTAFTNI